MGCVVLLMWRLSCLFGSSCRCYQRLVGRLRKALPVRRERVAVSKERDPCVWVGGFRKEGTAKKKDVCGLDRLRKGWEKERDARS